MRGYGQYCPISRGAEVFATRWTPLIVRNLLLGATSFGEIRRSVPGISRTLLVDRLRMLEQYGVIDRHRAPAGPGHVYALTEAGQALAPVCDALGTWGERWIELAPEHFDSHMVLLGLVKGLAPEQLPPGRTVIRFELGGRPRERYWLLLDRDGAEVCAKPPGDEDDAVVTTTPEWLAKWHLGDLTLGQAMHHGLMQVHGPRALVRTLASMGGLGSIKRRPLAASAKEHLPRS